MAFLRAKQLKTSIFAILSALEGSECKKPFTFELYGMCRIFSSPKT